MGTIRKETLEALQTEIKKCSENKMPYICGKIQTEEGLEYVTEKVRSILRLYPDFTLQNAIGHVEIELREIDLY